MKPVFATYKYHFFLIVIGVLWLAFFNFVLQVKQQQFIFPDSVTYIIAGESWYESFTLDALRPVLIAMITGFPLLFGFSQDVLFDWSLLVNAVCWLAVILMLFSILKSFLTEKKAFLFALAYMACIGSVILVFHLLTETVFTFFLVAIVFFFKKYTDTQKFKWLAFALSLLVISLLIKPAASLLIVVAVIYYSRILIRNWKRPSAFLVYTCLLAVGVHMQSMNKRYGNFTVSYIDTLAYYNYLGTRAAFLETGETFKQFDNSRAEYFNVLNLNEQKQIASEDFKNQLTNNTANFISAYAINVFTNSIMGSTAVEMCANINQTGYFEFFKFCFKVAAKLQIIFFSISGILLAVFYFFKSFKTAFFYAIVAVMILYFIGISGISSDQGDRFHLVVYPLILLLIARFIKDKTKWLA